MSTDHESVRQRIISSVFARRNTAGQEEQYVGHIKIWEDGGQDDGGRKPRYILLSRRLLLAVVCLTVTIYGRVKQ